MVDLITDDVLHDAARGEQHALGVVYRALAPTVQAFLHARGAEDAEGLTNEVFLQVLPRISTLTGGPAGLRTFVFSVAHARAVDEVRRRGRRPHLPRGRPSPPTRTVTCLAWIVDLRFVGRCGGALLDRFSFIAGR